MDTDASLLIRTRPAAVLWDMDGTIVDTEHFWVDSAAEIILEHVPEAGPDHLDGLESLVGMALLDGAQVIRSYGVDRPLEEIVDLQLDLVLQKAAREPFVWRPGAVELLSALAAEGIPLALVTMSYRAFADEVVSALAASPFDVVVTGDDVERGKPFPDAYLRAARLLDVNPAECVAIEDSPVGIRAATSAGAVTIGVPMHVDLGDTAADVIWPTLAGRVPRDLYLPLT